MIMKHYAGMLDENLFLPLDLVERKNFPKVINSLVLFAETVRTQHNFSIPLKRLEIADLTFSLKRVQVRQMMIGWSPTFYQKATQLLKQAEEQLPISDMSKQAVEEAMKTLELEDTVTKSAVTVEAQADESSEEEERLNQNNEVEGLLIELSKEMPHLKIQKLGGKYVVGNFVMNLKCVNGHLVARVGGGWLTMQEFLTKYALKAEGEAIQGSS